MDFWSRLLSPLSTGNTRQDQAKDPAKRLHRFEKEYGNLLLTWRKSSNLSKDSDSAETLEIRLQELTSILSDESRRPLPHPCIQFASLRQIYVPIGKIATTSYNEWIIKEAVLFFATLIESEEEAFVENLAFSASLTNLLVRITGANSVRLGLDTESRVVELAFNITTKIRLDPDILPAWFQGARQGEGQKKDKDAQESTFAGRTKRADFPLFYILMDYIHHEGKVGDFARTGLLYIIEAASRSTALEKWIVESDLSTLMATGLGALYSQLSRKLVIDHPSYNLPPILAFSDYQHPRSNLEIISSCSTEFQLHLETFLSHLLFWQDVLNHCKSDEVKSTLLEHFQVIFLQQLLYPSLLESSDIDGGSSVAVLTYLRRILESLDHPDMINLILHYLLALPEAISNPTELDPHTPIGDARRRKSKDLLTMVASKTGGDAATPLLFNLVDLVLSCLRSRNQQTIQTTLQLVSAILKRHHRYAVITLLRTEIISLSSPHRTIGAHEQEVQYLIDLAGSVGGQDNFDDVYDDMCKDTLARLESHPCSLQMVAPMVGKNNHRHTAVSASLRGAPKEVREHTLRPDDPVLNALLDIIETFFMNSVETNLSVTETLIDLGICGYMSIEGWLSRDPDAYVYDDDDADDDEEDASHEAIEDAETQVDPQAQASDESAEKEGPEREDDDGEEDTAAERMDDVEAEKIEKPTVPVPSITPTATTATTAEENLRRAREARNAREAEREAAMRKCRRRPRWDPSSLPRALGLLRRLCDQVDRYKETIPRFEELLQQRREAFQTADMIITTPMIPRERTPVRQGTPDHSSAEHGHRGLSPSRPSAFEGFAQRLLSELGTPSRSGSPRGRREKLRGSAAASGNATPSHRIDNYGLATPKAIPIPPYKDFFSTDHHKASSLPRTLSPSRIGDDIGLSFDSQEGMFASRMADFAAVDQTILARRVGLPTGADRRLSPIPLQFDKRRRPARSDLAASTKDDDDDEDDDDDDDDGDNPAIRPSDDEEDDDDDDDDGGPTGQDKGAESKSDEEDDGDRKETASVSHIVTNVIIFQSFVFELASLIQVRAGLFNEVRFA